MIELWVERLREEIGGLSERGAAKQLKHAITILNGIHPFSNMPIDSGDSFSLIWYEAWSPAILVGGALLSECSFYVHNNRNLIMGVSEIQNSMIMKKSLRVDFDNWKKEIKEHKAKAFQDWAKVCSGTTSASAIYINFDFSDIFCVPDFDDNDETEVLEDQVWQHRSYKDVTCQVIGVDTNEIEVIIVSRDSRAIHGWKLGKRYFFSSADDFIENWNLYKDIESGATCKKCKQHYPYAQKSKDFTCYSCRNGWS
jgi:hypothetical protein